jgi:hypothetical protein
VLLDDGEVVVTGAMVVVLTGTVVGAVVGGVVVGATVVVTMGSVDGGGTVVLGTVVVAASAAAVATRVGSAKCSVLATRPVVMSASTTRSGHRRNSRTSAR